MDKRDQVSPRAAASAERPLAELRPSAKLRLSGHRELWAGVRIGSGITGFVALVAAADSHNDTVVAPVLVVWAVLAALTLGMALIRGYRSYRRRPR